MRKPPADPPFGPVPFAGLRLPFVDRFGQFAHADWPEKVRDPSELAADLRAERAALRPPPASWDRFGGWRDGPALEATGAFRVERLDGRWRLVDPDGRLFFSYGVDTLRHYTDAPNGRRHPDWYETEPPPNGRMAFTHWNLQRKFGKIDYLTDYYDFILRRLDDWGFNTIGRWSARRLPLLERRRPYLLLLDSPARAPRIPGTRHYDPYHPDFALRYAEGVASQTRDPGVARAADDPFCIGLSIDNEPPFGGMIGAMLVQDASGCPAKNAFLAAVRARHPDLGALNAAWGTAFPTWPAVAALAAPVPGSGFAADASAFLLDWLRRYFSAARAAVKALAPRRLYFACAFGGADAPPVAWDAAAEHADALLADVHLRGVESWRPLGTGAAPERPVLIGAFTFGCLDRGMLSAGPVPTPSQAARAEALRTFVRGALSNPLLVGCHYFQYRDQPLVGRDDGEAYQIGFVDVCDRPYREVAKASREIGERLYSL